MLQHLHIVRPVSVVHGQTIFVKASQLDSVVGEVNEAGKSGWGVVRSLFNERVDCVGAGGNVDRTFPSTQEKRSSAKFYQGYWKTQEGRLATVEQ